MEPVHATCGGNGNRGGEAEGPDKASGRKGRGLPANCDEGRSESRASVAWRLWMPGLFDGEHIFEIEPLGPESVKFIQREEFSGLLVPLMARTIDQTLTGFEEMNRALKERVEAGGKG
ncbi:MAG TPA: SRPBCC domain-containing protein [Methanothrix sp.]|nr:SRPBCC domain-containing protein [Methanothrix sp.]